MSPEKRKAIAEKAAAARAGLTRLCRRPFDSLKEAMMTVLSQERQVRISNALEVIDTFADDAQSLGHAES